MKFIVLILTVAAAVQCVPVNQDESVLRLVVGNFVDCMNSDLNLCLKEHALKATERIGSVRQLNILDGLTIYTNPTKQRESRSLEPLSNDIEERKKQVTERLWESTTDLIENGEVELSYGGPDEKESRSLGEGEDEARGKKKKQLKKKLKLLIPLAILAKIKVVAIITFAIVVIAASLFKLAVLAKVAFIAKLIAIIKALILKKKSGWTEESHYIPHYEEHGHESAHGSDWDGGWSRSKKESNDLAYSAYTPQ